MTQGLAPLSRRSFIAACSAAGVIGLTQAAQEPANDLRPRFLRCPSGPSFGDLDYNDGPTDPPGPDKKDWRKHVGEYRMLEWGKPLDPLKVHVRNGYLYLDERKLIVEHEPGLFFSADGEALDLRGRQLMWQSIPIQRMR